MPQNRLILVSRRFWPLVGGAERAIAGLAQEFHESGHDVRVLTARWESQWPNELVHREVPVTRLPNPKTRGWGTFRYMYSLKSWLYKNRDQYDAVLVSMLKHDAYAAVKTLERLGKPVILRAEGAGATGDCQWHADGRFGMRIRKVCQRADAIIAPSERVYSELLAAGFEKEKVHYVANGVAASNAAESGGSIDQGTARRSLGEAHPILNVGPGEPLVVYTGRLDIEKGLLDLVEAWRTVAEVFPSGRLWLVGEGEDGRIIWDRIKELNLNYQVVMPGSFDEVSDLLAAADAFVLPSYQEGMSLSLLEAMAAGIPVVVSDIPGNRTLVDETRGWVTPAREPAQLANALLDAIRKRTVAQARAEAAQQFVLDRFSLNSMAENHLKIIQQVLNTQRVAT